MSFDPNLIFLLLHIFNYAYLHCDILTIFCVLLFIEPYMNGTSLMNVSDGCPTITYLSLRLRRCYFYFISTSSSSSCHQTVVFHLSTQDFAVSLNFERSSKVHGRARRVHCSMCAVFSVARPHTHVVSPSNYCQFSAAPCCMRNLYVVC